jgi:hypothetical protein
VQVAQQEQQLAAPDIDPADRGRQGAVGDVAVDCLLKWLLQLAGGRLLQRRDGERLRRGLATGAQQELQRQRAGGEGGGVGGQGDRGVERLAVSEGDLLLKVALGEYLFDQGR